MGTKVEQQREHFNTIAERYEVGRTNANHKCVKSLIWESALAPLHGLRGRKIRMLEPMCGFAEGLEIARDIAGLDCDYFGFDYSDAVVANLQRASLGATLWQADVTTYHPERESFDLVFIIGGLHHVPDHASDVVDRVASALKPGGFFVSFEPTHGNPFFKTIRDRIYAGNEIFDEETERAFSVPEYKSFFHSAGLEEVHVTYPGLLAYVLYYNTYAFPFLNWGGTRLVELTFSIDRLFMDSAIGRFFSFATLSIWRKPHGG